MKKIDKKLLSFFKDTIEKAIIKTYSLDKYYYYMKISYNYSKEYQTNDITIKVNYKVKSTSETTFTVYYYFMNDQLQNFTSLTSHNFIGVRIDKLDWLALKQISTICDSVKEFYKWYENKVKIV